MLTAIITGVITGCVSAWFAARLSHYYGWDLHRRTWLLEKRARVVEELINSLEACLKELSGYHSTAYSEATMLPFRTLDAEYARETLEPFRDKIGNAQSRWSTWFAYDLRRTVAWLDDDKRVLRELTGIGNLVWQTYEELFNMVEGIRSVKATVHQYPEEQLRKIADGPRSTALLVIDRKKTSLNELVPRYQQELVVQLRGMPLGARRSKWLLRARRRLKVWFSRAYLRVTKVSKGTKTRHPRRL